MPQADSDVISFGERLLTLLDQGSFVATYKYAVLIGLMDLCLEKTNRHGVAPDSVTTPQLARKVIELYWPHTSLFRGRTLLQNAGGQARILTDILRFRESLDDPSVTLTRAIEEDENGHRRLLRAVERTLILMPLPRLQVVGGVPDRLIYEIGWGSEIERDSRRLTRYLNGKPNDFDHQIRLLPSVGEYLVQLNGLLRPLIYRAWSSMVAQLNDLDESRLDRFLFGVNRTQLAAVRPVLAGLQDGVCFYCRATLTRDPDVDHFIPWARYPDNSIDNLVVADRGCNAAKRDFLAAAKHIDRWRERNSVQAASLAQLAASELWEAHPEDTLGVARGLYLRLRPEAKLWLGGSDFSPTDPAELRRALG
jgi:hypothetical protein